MFIEDMNVIEMCDPGGVECCLDSIFIFHEDRESFEANSSFPLTCDPSGVRDLIVILSSISI